MTWYRRYKALYDFQARSQAELTMQVDQTLLVELLPDGTWPPPEKWMQGYNEVTSQSGEFPGGAYVELVEEFEVQPVKSRSPPPLPPGPEPGGQQQAPPLQPPQPSPRHHPGIAGGFPMPGLAGGGRPPGYAHVNNDQRMTSPKVGEGEEEEAPPPPPRRVPRGGSEGHISASSLHSPQGRGSDATSPSQAPPPQAPPKPQPRKGSASASRRRDSGGGSGQRGPVLSPVTSPSHGSLSEDKHRWSKVTFSIPVQCTACESGLLNVRWEVGTCPSHSKLCGF